MILIYKFNKIILITVLVLCINILFLGFVKKECFATNLYMYDRGSKSDIIYFENIPIYISISYSYEEEEGENEYSKSNKRLISLDTASAVCRSTDYRGFLNTSSSYSGDIIYINIYGTLYHKTDKAKNVMVNEKYTFYIK